MFSPRAARRFFLTAAILSLPLVSSVHAYYSAIGYSDDERYLKAATTIAVVEVISAETDRANTYVDPPKLRLKVLKRIRGAFRKKEIMAVWSSPVPFDLNNKTSLRKWYQEQGGKPYPPPDQGSRWIVILAGPSLKGDYFVDGRCRYFYSKETFDWVTSVIPEYFSQQSKSRELKAGEEEI